MIVSTKRPPAEMTAARQARAAALAAAEEERERRLWADPAALYSDDARTIVDSDGFAAWSAMIGTDPNGYDGEMIAEQRRVLVTRPQHPGVWASEVRTDDYPVTAREALAADAAALLGAPVRGRVPVQALRNAARCVMTAEGNATVGEAYPSGAPKVVGTAALRPVTAEQYAEQCAEYGLPVALLTRAGDAPATWAEARALAGSGRDAAARDARAVVGATPYVTTRWTSESGRQQRTAEGNERRRDARRVAAAAEALAAASSDSAWPQPRRGRPSAAVTLWRDLLAAAEGDRVQALAALRAML